MSKKIPVIISILIAGMLGAVPSAQATPQSSFVESAVYDGQIIRVIGKDIPSEKGIYVVQCANTDSQRFNPQTDCTTREKNPTSTLWFNAAPSQQAQGASDPNTSQPFTVLREVAGFDCMISACALVTIRDHIDPTDMSMLSIFPLRFSKIPASAKFHHPQGTYTTKKGATWKLARKNLKSVGGQLLSWQALTPKVCSIRNSGGKVYVHLNAKGICFVNATSVANAKYQAGSFLWQFTAK